MALQVMDRVRMQGAREPAAFLAAGHQDDFVVIMAAGLRVHRLDQFFSLIRPLAWHRLSSVAATVRLCVALRPH